MWGATWRYYFSIKTFEKIRKKVLDFLRFFGFPIFPKVFLKK
jgi:hypothetical protein